MLLRSSSAPILRSSTPLADLVREHEHDGFSPIPHNMTTPFPSFRSPVSLCCASYDFRPSSRAHESLRGSGDFEKGFIPSPRMRRAQSENDLAVVQKGIACRSAASSLMSAAADENEFTPQCRTSPQTLWTRRLSSCNRRLSFDLTDAIREECELSDSEAEEDNEICTSTEMSAANLNLMRTLNGFQEQERTAVAARVLPSSPASVSGSHVESFRLEDGEIYTSVAISSTGQLLVCNSKGCRPITESERLHPMLTASAVGLGVREGSGGTDGMRGGTGGFRGDSNSSEERYKHLLQADPHNSLFLGNYAQYLSETKHEYKKAEEYYERAILASPSDGNLLSKYAKHTWDVHNDHDRADFYHDQAMKAAPDDSHILASYASFLWNSEDNEAEPSPFTGNPVSHDVSNGIPSVVVSA